MPLQVTTFVQLLPDLARTVHALASAATEIYIAEGGRGDCNFLVEEFEAQGFSVTRLDLPPELAAGRCGVYHMRKREEASGAGGTGGAGEDAGGVGGGGVGVGGGEGEEEDDIFADRLEALAQRGEFSTMKALLREREVRQAVVSDRQGAV